jgi:hypothetical protein
MIAEAATGPALGEPEAAMSLAWAYLTLAREAKLDLPADKLKALAGVVPLNVRVEPYSVKGVETLAAPAQFGERMKKVNAFESGAFRDAFGGIVGK